MYLACGQRGATCCDHRLGLAGRRSDYLVKATENRFMLAVSGAEHHLSHSVGTAEGFFVALKISTPHPTAVLHVSFKQCTRGTEDFETTRRLFRKRLPGRRSQDTCVRVYYSRCGMLRSQIWKALPWTVATFTCSTCGISRGGRGSRKTF